MSNKPELEADELLERAVELQKNMFSRKMTLTDNGTVSLLIEALERALAQLQKPLTKQED